MITGLLGLFVGVLFGIFIAAICSAGKYHDLTIENRVLINKLVEIYKVKDNQDEN